MSSQHTRLRTLVRTELRALLSDLLAALPPSGPVARPSTPPGEGEALGRALDAWVALGGAGRGCTAREALDAGRERPGPWEAFCEAVEGMVTGPAVAACRSLAVDAVALGGREPRAATHALGNVLKQLRGRVTGGRVMVGVLDRRTKVMRWRVVEGVRERVLGRSSEEPSSPAPLPRCLWCEDRIDMYGHSARHTLSSASPGVRVWRRVEDRREEVKVGERIACGEALEVEDGGAGGGIGIGTAYG